MGLDKTKFDKIKNILACPNCHGNLDYKDEKFTCKNCQSHYYFKNKKIYFTDSLGANDSLDKLKNVLKKYLGDMYFKYGIQVISPSYPFNFHKEVEKEIKLDSIIAIDLGSGVSKYNENIICLDICDYSNVDIVCDISKLPFKKESIDIIMSRSVMEHVPDPYKIFDEIKRCTKVGGYTAHLIPWMMPFHASPYDFHRFSHKAVSNVFSNWSLVSQFAPFGFMTLILHIITEFFPSLLFSAESKYKSYFYLFLCLILFPIKYLDIFFVRKKNLISIAPSIFSFYKKNT